MQSVLAPASTVIDGNETMISRKTLGDQIARIIRRADYRYFWENYATQADAVLEWMDEEGYILAPKEPTKAMLDAGIEAIKYGRLNKYEVVRALYVAMINEPPQGAPERRRKMREKDGGLL